MNSAAIAPTIDATCETFPPKTLRVMALYDDLKAQENAHAALEALMKACGSRVQIESRAWNFNMLTRLDLRHASARIASSADLMIVAAQPSAALPAHVKSWMTTCLRQHSNTLPALMAADEECFRKPSGNQSALICELLAIAATWSTRLLCNQEFNEKMEPHWMNSLAPPESGRELQSTVQDSLSVRCRTRGGINE